MLWKSTAIVTGGRAVPGWLAGRPGAVLFLDLGLGGRGAFSLWDSIKPHFWHVRMFHCKFQIKPWLFSTLSL